MDSDLLNDDKYRFPSEAWEDTKKDKSVEDLPNPSNLLGKTGQNNLMGNYSDYGVPLFDDATENSSFGEYPSLSNSASELVAEFPTSPVNPSTAVSSQTVEVPNGIAQSISLSRFQQQMSGEWNQRVLRKERYTEPVEATPSTGSLAKYEAPESVQSDIAPPATKFQRQIGGQLNTQVLQQTVTQSDEFPFAEQGMAPVTDNEIMPDFLEFTGTRNLTRASAIASGKASKLGASTLFSQNGSGSIPEELSVNDSASLEVTESNLGQVLAEIDQDYMALRAKLVRIIESREKFASKPVVGSTDQIEAKEPYMSSYSQSVNDSQ